MIYSIINDTGTICPLCFLQFQYLIDVDMTSYLKFFHISLQESYISNKANASVKGWEK